MIVVKSNDLKKALLDIDVAIENLLVNTEQLEVNSDQEELLKKLQADIELAKNRFFTDLKFVVNASK